MDCQLITAPTTLINDLPTVKTHCSVDLSSTDFDAVLGIYSGAAHEYIQEYCNIAVGLQTRLLTLDGFPCGSYPVAPESELALLLYRGGPIEIPRPPLKAVDWIKYYDSTGQLVTLDPSAYEVHTETGDDRGYVCPVYNSNWPSYQPKKGALQVQFKCGEQNVTPGLPIPFMLRAAHLIITNDLFKNSESNVIGATTMKVEHSATYDRLLAPFVNYRFS